jgi:DNA-binding SARP family transcriptional activator
VLSFQILGPLEVHRDGASLPLGSAKQRALVALLLLNAGEVVSTGRLLDGLWGEAPPATAEHLLHVYVSRLRKLLEADGHELLVTRPPGYVLRLRDGDELDAAMFESAVRAARSGGTSPADALAGLDRALDLWRGAVLADLADEPFVTAAAARLEELRAVAEEERIHALLALGRHEDAVPELETLVARYPLRERLRAEQMLALYRCGRQADALAAFATARRLLVEELGVDPGPELRTLEQDILRHAPELEAPAAGPVSGREPAPEPAAREGEPREGSSFRRLAVIALVGLVAAGAVAAAAIAILGGSPGGGSVTGTGGDSELALSWIEVPSAEAFGGPGDQVVVGGADTRFGFLALGYSAAARTAGATTRDYEAAVWTASEPERWTRVEDLSFGGYGNQRAADAAVLGDRLVIVGIDGSHGDVDAAVWVSDDEGSTWSRVGVETEALRVVGSDEAMRDVVAVGDRLVAVGFRSKATDNDAAVWYSGDGLEWVALTQALGAPGEQEMAAVVPFGSGALAAGFTTGSDRDAALWRSDDGVVWEAVSSGAFGGEGIQQINALATGCGGVIAVGQETIDGEIDAAVWRSADGATWERLEDPDVFGGEGPQQMFTVACSPDGLVAAGRDGIGPGADGAMWTSVDGLRWERVPPDTISALADPAGRQSVKVLLPIDDGMIALGAEGRGADEDADAWIGSP